MTKRKAIAIGGISALFLFFLFAIPSAMISNSFFIRMAPPTMYEWAILLITAALGGAYVGFYHYKNQEQTKATCAATSGSFLGFLTFGCAFCNKILIFILGMSGIMTYFLPIQPYLGLVGIGLLSYGIYSLMRSGS